MTTDHLSPLLPYPAVSAPRRRPSVSTAYARGGGAGLAGWATLKQRARTTNLAVFLLAGVAAVSLLVNVRMWLGEGVLRRPSAANFASMEAKVPLSIRATLPTAHPGLTHLVMVPGHAIWTGCDATSASRLGSFLNAVELVMDVGIGYGNIEDSGGRNAIAWPRIELDGYT